MFFVSYAWTFYVDPQPKIKEHHVHATVNYIEVITMLNCLHVVQLF